MGLDSLHTEVQIQIAAALDDVAGICFGLTSKSNYDIVEAVSKGTMRRIRRPALRNEGPHCRGCQRYRADKQNRLAELLWEWMGQRCVWCGQGSECSSHHCSVFYYGLCLRCQCNEFRAEMDDFPAEMDELKAGCAKDRAELDRRELPGEEQCMNQARLPSADELYRMVQAVMGPIEPQYDEAAQETKEKPSLKSKILKWLLCSA